MASVCRCTGRSSTCRTCLKPTCWPRTMPGTRQALPQLRRLSEGAALYHLDNRDPNNLAARTLTEEIARVVRARAANPGWIAGMMRHGFRGGAELAATLDHLGAFAHLSGSVPPQLIDLYHEATLGQSEVRAFLEREIPMHWRRWSALRRAHARASGAPGEIPSWPACGRHHDRFAVKGWCPDAWHPMISGDGLLVRVKPRLGRLTREQALPGDAAATCGSGLIDLTRRQSAIRGVAQDRWPLLIQRLIGAGISAARACTRSAATSLSPDGRRTTTPTASPTPCWPG